MCSAACSTVRVAYGAIRVLTVPGSTALIFTLAPRTRSDITTVSALSAAFETL